MPLRETGEILDDPGRIRPEVVGAVLMNEHSALVILILGIAPDVITLLDDGASGPTFIGKSLSQNKS